MVDVLEGGGVLGLYVWNGGAPPEHPEVLQMLGVEPGCPFLGGNPVIWSRVLRGST